MPFNRGTREPFRIASAEEFAQVRELLVRSGFGEAPLCARAGVPSIFDLPRSPDRSAFKESDDPQSLFVRLLIDGERVPGNVVRSILASDDMKALDALGLLHTLEHEDRCAATVAIVPIEDRYIASDRAANLDDPTADLPADTVRSPRSRETQCFLRLMPRERTASVLDLCAGTGVASLVAAPSFAQHATAVDISERAVRFAEFNRALNGVSNVRVARGDLYEPVQGERFDLILARPPYLPGFERSSQTGDAGDDGEHVTRRLFAGLAEHLKPGGQLFCDCMLTERRAAPLEHRVREMFGDASEEFDIVVAQGRPLQPLHFFADQARAGFMSFERLGACNAVVQALAIEQLVFASILVQRRETERPVITTRRALSSLTSAADLQWVLRWMVETAAWDPNETRKLLASRPRTLPHTELRSRSSLKDGQWSVEDCVLATLAPFAVEAACPAWYATLLQFCDGRMTAREHLQYLRDTHAVPDSAPEEVFAMMIRQLVDAGLIEVDEFRLPDATAMRDTMADRERTTAGHPIERAD